MRRTAALLALSLVAGIAAGLASPPTDLEIDRWFAEFGKVRAAFGKDGKAGQDDYWQMWRDWVAKLNLEEMTIPQLSRVQEKRVLTFGEAGARVEPTLKKAEAAGGPDGAVAEILRLQLIAGDAKQSGETAKKSELVGKLVTHPGLPEVIRTGRSKLLLRSLGEIRDPAALRPHYANIESVVASLNKEGSPDQLDSIFDFYENAAAAAPDEASRERLRESLARYGERALAECRARGAKDLSFEERDVLTLKGAATRGKLIGQEAPALKADWCSDPAFKGLGDLKGNVVVLDFWTTTCGPCIQAFPKMRELRDHYKGYPVRVVGVTYHQGTVLFPGKNRTEETGKDTLRERAVMAEYLRDFDLSWPNVMTDVDTNGAEYGVRGIPSYVLIDARGIVREKDYFNNGKGLEGKYRSIDALLAEAGLPHPGGGKAEAAAGK